MIFVIESDTTTRDRWLVAEGPVPEYTNLPLDEQGCPGLYRDFSCLPVPLHDIDVLEFAEQHGFLGVGMGVWPGQHTQYPRGRNGERLGRWEQEIRTLRRTVVRWDALQQGHIQQLRSEISAWETSATPQPKVTWPEEDPLPDDRVKTRAQFSIEVETNVYLGKHTATCIRNEPGDVLELQVVAHNLLGSLWLQFAESVLLGRMHRRCLECNEWMAISQAGQLRRKDRELCSNRCRTRFNRHTKSLRAHTLAMTGRYNSDMIADRLHMDRQDVDAVFLEIMHADTHPAETPTLGRALYQSLFPNEADDVAAIPEQVG